MRPRPPGNHDKAAPVVRTRRRRRDCRTRVRTPPAQLTPLHVLERKVGEQVYTGPATGTQLIALRHLEHIASEQASKAATALIEDAPTLVDALAPTLIPEQRERARVHRATDRRERRIVLALREVAAVPWPLYAVLAVQCVMSLHLIWANTAFLDEAIYVWSGRVQLWHLTYGLHAPVYATYFSGAPIIYPPPAGFCRHRRWPGRC